MAISLALAGQGMVFGLGYNNALRAGEAPFYGSTAYWSIHGALFLSVAVVGLLLGAPLARNTWRALRAGRITVESLFVLSALGALAGSTVSSLTGEGAVYYEVVAVVLCVYTVGKRVGDRGRTEVERAALDASETFDRARVVSAGGVARMVRAAQVVPGDIVEVRPGEAIAVDGIVTGGRGYVEETSITGEPRPLAKGLDDSVLAGSWAVDGAMTIEVKVPYGQRVFDGILASVRSAAAVPSALEAQAQRLVAWFVPFVAAIAALTFLGWHFLSAEPWWRALFNAMAVLLVACPCALGLAAPIAVWTGLQRLLRQGYVARSGRLMDGLGAADTVVFDKTGTLSEARPVVADAAWAPAGAADREWVLSAVAALEERAGKHPVARSLLVYVGPREALAVENFRLVPGAGVEGYVEGRRVRVGERMFSLGTSRPGSVHPVDPGGAVVVSVDGVEAVSFVVAECFRAGLAEAGERLRGLGLRVSVLTGDPRPPAGLPDDWEVRSGLLPEAKVRFVDEAQARGRRILYVGDGINDAGAMARASGSIAMGSAASLTRASADAVFLGDDFSSLPDAIALARRVRIRLRGNLLFAVQYNVIGMALAAAGILHPVVAALLMVGSSALVSVRAARSVRDESTAERSVSSLSAAPAA
ncbi:MAG: cation-translocating P-type ATPase [Opitutales bacterium]|nr:cation-translocating P-type ATPase [Opitutales bacterium]